MLTKEEEKKYYDKMDTLKEEINVLEEKVRQKRWRHNLKERVYILERKKKELEYELEGKDPSTVPIFF